MIDCWPNIEPLLGYWVHNEERIPRVDGLKFCRAKSKGSNCLLSSKLLPLLLNRLLLPSGFAQSGRSLGIAIIRLLVYPESTAQVAVRGLSMFIFIHQVNRFHFCRAKAKRQYLLTSQVSRYSRLALQSRIDHVFCWCGGVWKVNAFFVEWTGIWAIFVYIQAINWVFFVEAAIKVVSHCIPQLAILSCKAKMQYLLI